MQPEKKANAWLDSGKWPVEETEEPEAKRRNTKEEGDANHAFSKANGVTKDEDDANLAFFKAHASRFKRITTSEESAYAALRSSSIRASLQTDKAYWARACRGEKANVLAILESMVKGLEGKSDYLARACQYEKTNILAILAKLRADKTDQQSSREFEGLTNSLNNILAIIKELASQTDRHDAVMD
jgi:hypothetical protein